MENDNNSNEEENENGENNGENEMNEEEDILIPNRPELEEIKEQTITLLFPSENSPKHARTLFFKNNPEVSQIKPVENLKIEELTIKDKKFMILYKAYKNLPLCLSGPMEYNNIIRSKLYKNTNIIWKLLQMDKMNPLLKQLNKYQRFNHFPFTWQLCRKDDLYTNYTKMKKKFPDDYNFMPETYILPKDFELISKQLKEYNQFDTTNLLLIKPVASSKCRGVRILMDTSTVPEKGIITHYISEPHLINKKKYDLRIYLLITGFAPLKIYLYDNGFVRFCPEDYTLDPDKMTNKSIHLTNYYMNKIKNTDKENEKELENIKTNDLTNYWSLYALKGYFTEQKLDFKTVWERIKDMLIKTVLSIMDIALPTLKGYNLTSCNLFELYGVDILLDKKLNPWLMEVNLNPSLDCDTDLDKSIKSKLLTDVFNIIGIVPFSHDGRDKPLEKQNYYKTKIDEAVTESLCEFERPSGGFERIFPTEKNIDIYKKFIAAPGIENCTLWDVMQKRK